MEHGPQVDSQERSSEMSAYVLIRSVDGAKYTQEIEAGEHRLFADEPSSFGGNNRGPGPYEMLLAALGS